MSAANVRAGLARVSEHPDYQDAQWSPIGVAMAEYLDPGMPNLLRFLKLGINALYETLKPVVEQNIQLGSLPLLIGIPSKREGLHEDLETRFLEEINRVEKEHKLQFFVEFIPDDHVSGLLAIKEAKRRLDNGETEFCIAGGIESYINNSTLAWLEEQEYLKCSDNKWGMTPGEAAGFCLLTTSKNIQSLGLDTLGEIVEVAHTREMIENGDICIGKALSKAILDVVGMLPEGEKVQQVFCDMNGQRHRANEYGYSVMRLNKYLEDPKDFVAPANLWGDLGAASAPLLTGLMTEAGRKGYAKGPNNLLFAMSPNGKRAAALIKLNRI
ncbi:MAG: hypothetical protein MJE63_17435 [Proteobacteria bacterium]|nr:hypothetical protein [Pseudomonadota bacterium]